MFLREKSAGELELGIGLEQLKKIYVALFRQLHAGGVHAFDDLDEDDMLLTIQTYLQRAARVAGVDATNHSEWDAFLGIQDAPACSERFSTRSDSR